MIARAGTGWQYALADLSLILFLTCAAALGETAGVQPPARDGPPVLAEPVAVWRASADGPGLAQWLAEQPQDPRLRLTLAAGYGPGGAPAALAEAERLTGTAAGRPLRIVLEPAPSRSLAATLTWDAGVAHALQRPLPNKETDR